MIGSTSCACWLLAAHLKPLDCALLTAASPLLLIPCPSLLIFSLQCHHSRGNNCRLNLTSKHYCRLWPDRPCSFFDTSHQHASPTRRWKGCHISLSDLSSDIPIVGSLSAARSATLPQITARAGPRGRCSYHLTSTAKRSIYENDRIFTHGKYFIESRKSERHRNQRSSGTYQPCRTSSPPCQGVWQCRAYLAAPCAVSAGLGS